MIEFYGKWYDGKTSVQTAAVLRAYDSGAVRVQHAETGDSLFRDKQFNARVSDRLADTPRFLTFPDGNILETDDNSSVDRLLDKLHKPHWSRLVHKLESKLHYVLAAFVLMVLIGAGMVIYGFPAAAKIISASLPQSFFEVADQQSLEVLDRMFFKPSELDAEIQNRVRSHFNPIITSHASQNIRMIFRKGGRLGPNAFALPGGTILFTDELIEMAEDDNELLAIMAHETGHVVHQHGMRRMVQDSLLSFAILALTGDASGVSEIFLGLPVVLTELAYSREFEREADEYALVYLQANDIPTTHFANILSRLDKLMADKKTETSEESNGEDARGKWWGYLSTHPPTPERIEAFREDRSRTNTPPSQ
jgi:Zn-dependent protease with chaperone function